MTDAADSGCLNDLLEVPWSPLSAPELGVLLLVKSKVNWNEGCCTYSLCATDCVRVWVASSTDGAATEAELRAANPHLDFALEQAANIAREAFSCAPDSPQGQPLKSDAVHAEGGTQLTPLRLVVTRRIGFYTFMWPFVLQRLAAGDGEEAEVLRVHLIEPSLLLLAQLASSLARLHVAPPELPIAVVRAAPLSADAVAFGPVACALYSQLMHIRSTSGGNAPTIRRVSSSLLTAESRQHQQPPLAAVSEIVDAPASPVKPTTTETELELKRRREIEERVQRQREAKEQKAKKRKKLDFV